MRSRGMANKIELCGRVVTAIKELQDTTFLQAPLPSAKRGVEWTVTKGRCRISIPFAVHNARTVYRSTLGRDRHGLEVAKACGRCRGGMLERSS